MPKVTVIIPAFNSERYIKEALDSVLAQTFTDLEVIVVDDGSTDKTAEIAEMYGRPVICLKKKNEGASSARNHGMSHARGEYLAFLDADDLWAPTKLEKQVDLLDSHADIGLCFVGTENINQEMQVISRIDARSYPDYTAALLLHSCIVTGSCSSVVMRSSLAQQTGGFDPSLTNYEDWEYWLRLSLHTKFAPIPEYLARYRSVPGSMSGNPRAVERDLIAALAKFFDSNVPEKYLRIKGRTLSNNWIVVSGEYWQKGDYASSVRCLWKGLVLHPLNIVRPLGMPLRALKRYKSSRISHP